MSQPPDNQSANISEKRTKLIDAKPKYISKASGCVSTKKGQNVRSFFNLVLNQARAVFNGTILVESDINLLETSNNEDSEQDKIDFFMSIETDFNDEFINIPFSQHQS